MFNMKTRKITMVIMATTMIICVGCNTHQKSLHFDNPKDAVNACDRFWRIVSSQRENIDIKTVTDFTSQWMELQDSTYSCFYRDSAVTIDDEIALKFYIISDSVRNKITRMVLSQPRSLNEAVYYKINTISERKKVLKSKEYQEVMAFYNKIDRNPIISVDDVIPNYIKLLQTKSIKQEKDLLVFLEEEDRLFRSLCAHLPAFTQDNLKMITEGTETVFRNLNDEMIHSDKEKLITRMNFYLVFRTNRRILQNADACRQDIQKKVKLNQQLTANYKWMLIQPFVTLDEYAMAYMSEEQEQKLLTLADDIENCIMRLDGKKKEDTQKLIQVMVEYILNSHVKMII